LCTPANIMNNRDIFIFEQIMMIRKRIFRLETELYGGIMDGPIYMAIDKLREAIKELRRGYSENYISMVKEK